MNAHEIDLLRTELLQNYSEITQYNSIFYTVIVAILAYAIQSQNYLLCLLPYLVIFPILFICELKKESICRIGAYLCVFLCEDEYKWEKRLHILDEIQGHLKVSKWLIFERDHMVYYLVSLTSSVSASYKITTGEFSCPGMWIRLACVLIFTVFALIIIKSKIIYIPTERQKYIDRWKKVQEYEVITTTDKTDCK